MLPRASALFLAGAVVLSTIGAIRAEEPPSSTPSTPSVERSLAEMVALLRLHVAQQRTGLAIQRLEISRRELAARERELYDARVDEDGHRQSLAQLENRIEMWESSVEADEIENADRRMMERQVEIERNAIDQRIWRAQQRILDLEVELRRLRDDLDRWEAVIDGSPTLDG